MHELELYLHIPFCVQKCRYCDFLSVRASEDVHNLYVKQMLNEIRGVCREYEEAQVTTVFIGGGTPSVLAACRMREILEQVFCCFAVCPDAEITVECNPGTLDAGKLHIYRELGVNRISMGMQSADDTELRLLGRIHTYEQFVSNYSLARDMGFENINVDIISALPGQKVSNYEKTLEKVIRLRPKHVSAYSLIIEEGTPFFDKYGRADQLREQGKDQSLLPTEEEDRQMYVLTKELLKSAGYDRYEISNYAMDGFECRHNAGYWMRKNYLGIGLGAASLVDNVRFANTADLKEYLALDFSDEAGGISRLHQGKECLSRQAQMEEFMFLGLRMMRGVSADRFYAQFSQTMEDVYGAVLDKQLKEHFIQRTKDGYCLTDVGIDVSNYVMAQYLF